MRLLNYLFCVLLTISALPAWAQKADFVDLSGVVVDQQGQPIRLASVNAEEGFVLGMTTIEGRFALQIPANLDKVSVRVSYVGKKSVQITVKKADFSQALRVVMLDNSLTLDSVAVNASFANSKNSISSIIFDEEAIERVQAFSLMDVLNTLPGKQMTAPNINGPQTLTLRNSLGGNYDINNSLGIPIIMDGVTLSNDANMQSRLVGQWGMGSAIPTAQGGTTADVPFRGIDLREIPVESIEKIEVIQGVASAEYGELTDGAIIIDRKTGKTPFQFTTNVNGASRNYSLNKGINISDKLGGISLDGNHAISNSNPTDNFQEYRRYGLSARWNTPQYRHFRNRFSVDLNWRNDVVRLDPDDNLEEQYKSTESGVRFSNNLSFKVNSRLVRDINLMVSYSQRDQYTFKQYRITRGTLAIGGKDTTGIYEGALMDGRYLSEEEAYGKPVTASANLKFSSFFKLGQSVHSLNYGFSANYSNNGGKGFVVDPNRPRFLNLSNQNVRPYDFELTPSILNTALYFTDNFHFDWLGKGFSSNLGVRFDSQSGSFSVQPRLSTQVKLDNHWNIGLAYGLSSKSPTLLHRYPPPTWIDVPLITAQQGTSYLYLLYTEKVQLASEYIRPMKASQAEMTINYRDRYVSSRFNAYYKDNRDGFKSMKRYVPINLPDYRYWYDASLQKIVYEPSGSYTDYYDNSYNTIINGSNSRTYGFDWSLTGPKIPSINTSFSTSTSYIVSWEENTRILDMVKIESDINIDGEKIRYGLYNPLSNDRQHVLTSKLNTTTHIPKLGFVVMTNTDVFWMSKRNSRFDESFQLASGYLNKQMQQVMLSADQAALFPKRNMDMVSQRQRIVYANFSLSVAKEIGKKIRIAITTYNTFNLRPREEYLNPDTGESIITLRNSPLSVTGGITMKL